MSGAIPLVLLILGLVVAAPIAAFVALSRVRRLERRIADLEAHSGRAPSALPAPLPAPPTPADAAAGPVAADAEAATIAPPLRIPALDAAAARTSFDWETVIAGSWLNRVGLLAVAIGVSYFLKYAIDNDWIGPRGQVAAGALLGAGLVAWSTMFVKRGLGYFADGLAGLGAAVMYLSLWAGTSYYRFIGTDAGFAAMIVVTAAMLVIALGRNSQAVAVLAMIGGFATPWLVSTGRDAQVVLFLYLALHNAALLALARARSWRFLELPAFACTQVYFWGWFARFYTDAVLVRTALFGLLFFGQFAALPVIRVRRSAELAADHMILVLVNAAAFLFVLRALLWPEHRWMMALAALGLSGLHVMLARLVPDRAPAEAPVRLLFAGLALTFASIAIPIRLDGHWVTMAWAIQAGVLAWSGFSAQLVFPRTAAYAIFALVALRILSLPPHATTFVFNARLAMCLVVAASAWMAAWLAARVRNQLRHAEPIVVGVLAVAANILMLWALTLEIDLYFQIVPGRRGATVENLLARSLTISLLWTVYASALLMMGLRLKAAALRWQGLALFGLTTVKVFFIDLGYLSGLYRIASSVALGVVLLMVSFLYQRSLSARRPAGEESR